MDLEFLDYGPRALLVGFARRAGEESFRFQQAFLAAVKGTSLPGLVETTPSFTTALLRFSGPAERDAGRRTLSGWNEGALEIVSPPEGCLVEFPVSYGGPDLERVAASANLSVTEVIAAHCAPTYRVHCLGFSPGFPYLAGLDPRLHTPRLPSPRPRIPAGSVAIGGSHAGVYSVAGPGGWNIIGRTERPLFLPWKESVQELFAVHPGDRVRFVDSGRRDPSTGMAPDALSDLDRPDRTPRTPGNGSVAILRVLSAGLGLSIQDEGRPGFARFGVPPGGAMDLYAAHWANRLIENPSCAPVLELCLQGQRLEVLEVGWLAITGAAGGRSGVPEWSAFRARRGDILEFPASQNGIWSYLAVPGGVASPRILGSASAHPRAGIGLALGPGNVVFRSGEPAFSPPSATATRRVARDEIPDYSTVPRLQVWPGPQWRQFSPDALKAVFDSDWTVSSQSDRTGYRLRGPSLGYESVELVSEPVLPGTIQVPAGGEPIVTMTDGPTLGGYPKLGVLEPSDRARLAQVRPGCRVRFERIG